MSLIFRPDDMLGHCPGQYLQVMIKPRNSLLESRRLCKLALRLAQIRSNGKAMSYTAEYGQLIRLLGLGEYLLGQVAQFSREDLVDA